MPNIMPALSAGPYSRVYRLNRKGPSTEPWGTPLVQADVELVRGITLTTDEKQALIGQKGLHYCKSHYPNEAHI